MKLATHEWDSHAQSVFARVCVHVCVVWKDRLQIVPEAEQDEQQQQKLPRDTIKIKVWICLAYFL